MYITSFLEATMTLEVADNLVTFEKEIIIKLDFNYL